MATLQVALNARPAIDGFNKLKFAQSRYRDDLRKTDQQTKKLSQSMTGLGGVAGTLRKAFAGAFAGISAFMIIRSAISTIKDFGFEIATLGAVTEANEATMAAFEERARSLGATTEFSATQAAEGMTFLARAGFEANEVIAAIPATLDLATAGAIGLGEAADIASNVLSQFNLTAEETSRVGDILVNTANSANTNILQLAEALKFAGPVAGSLGISVEETAAAIGVLGDSGIQATLAGTNLRGMMAALLGPTEGAQKVIKKLGLSVEELDPSTNSLIDIFKKFKNANLDAGDALEIFGRRNVAAALVITQNVEKVNDLTKANVEAEGKMKKAAETMRNTLKGSFDALTSSIKEAYLTLGEEGLGGGLRGLIDTATGAIRILLGMSGGADGFTVASKQLATAIRGMTTALIAFVAIRTVQFLMEVVTNVKAATSAIQALRAAMVNHPLLALATVVAAATAALSAFVIRADEVTTRVKDLGDATNEMNKHIKAFASLSEQMAKAELFGRETEKADVIRQQIKELEDAYAGLLKVLEQGKGTEPVGAFFLRNMGIEFEEVLKDMEHFSERTQDILRDLGENARFKPIPLTDAIKAIELELERMKAIAIDAGIAAADSGKDDIQTKIDQAIAAKEARESLEKLIVTLQEEREAIRIGQELYDKQKTIEDATALAEEHKLENKKELIRAIEDEINKTTDLIIQQDKNAAIYEKLQQREKARLAAKTELNAYIESLRTENELIGLSNEEREIEEARRYATNLAIAAGVKNVDAYVASILKEISIMQNFTKYQKMAMEDEMEFNKYREQWLRDEERRLQEIENIANQFARPFVDAFAKIITSAESAKDILKNIFIEISNLALQTFVLTQLQAGLGSLFSGPFVAKGAIFDKQGMVPFAQGGIVDKPTVFPFANGNVGLMGEAGPEAIMPLERRHGRLGVLAFSDEERDLRTHRTVNVTMNVNAKDADSFRRSERQLNSDLRRMAGRI